MKNCNCNKEILCNTIVVEKNCNLKVLDNTFNCDYVQVYILQSNDLKKETLSTIVRESRDQDIIFSTDADGFYTIIKLTIPTDELQPYYYKEGYYYHNAQKVDLEELLNIDPRISLIQFEYLYHFCTCRLKNCFVKVCKEIFEQQSSICNKSTSTELQYKRDLIWSAINTIKYLVEMDQMEEAQRILKEISGCNGLCPDDSISDKNCGCYG